MVSRRTIKCQEGHAAVVFYGPAGERQCIPLPDCNLYLVADTLVPPFLKMNSGLQIKNNVRDELGAYHTSQQAIVIHEKMREF